jgi:hypothetical protein
MHKWLSVTGEAIDSTCIEKLWNEKVVDFSLTITEDIGRKRRSCILPCPHDNPFDALCTVQGKLNARYT